MRLIDIDSEEFIQQMYYPFNCETGEYEKFLVVRDDDIETLPTIDAIPIEYIKNQIDRWERSKCESYHAICYRHLIEEWKMENERKEEWHV